MACQDMIDEFEKKLKEQKKSLKSFAKKKQGDDGKEERLNEGGEKEEDAVVEEKTEGEEAVEKEKQDEEEKVTEPKDSQF